MTMSVDAFMRVTRPVLVNRAREASRLGGGTYEHLYGEGALHLWQEAYPNFDESKSPAKNWAHRVLYWKFSKMIRAAKSRKVGGEITLVYYGHLVDDNIESSSQDIDPDEALYRAERVRKIKSLLSVRERDLMEIYLSPPAELFTIARNLGDGSRWTAKHVALFFGMTLGQVEYSLRKIRTVSESVE